MKALKGDYTIYDGLERVNIDDVCRMLSTSYWAANRDRATIEKSIEHSVNFTLYENSKQIGFARIVTDHSTFAYLADLIIDEDYRGNGLGKWFAEVIINDGRWSNTLIMLSTKDAHTMYEKFGFELSDKLMARR